MRLSLLLLSVVLVVSAAPNTKHQRIVGGELTTIDQYPYQAALLESANLVSYSQSCGGTILNQRSILSAAHCFGVTPAAVYHRVRVGSTFANSGGVVHTVAQIINHPSYNQWTYNNDISVVRLSAFITFNSNAQPGAVGSYVVADNQPVWATGWGLTEHGWQPSEQLRHVQVWTINQAVCQQRYGGGVITDNMLCSGWLDVGGRDQCNQDSGGPLLHNGVVVGVCSFGAGCGDSFYPGVNARVSRYVAWIQANA